MKRTLKVLSLASIIVGLAACSGQGSSSASSLVPSSSAESSSASTQPSSSSSSADPYKGRIKTAELSVVDLVDAPYRGDDPLYYEDPKSVEDYYREEKLKMYYLDELDSVYYIDVASFGKLLEAELAEGYSAYSEDKGATASWTVKKGDELVFRLAMDANEQTLSIDGELDSNFLKSARNGVNGEADRAQIVNEYLPGHENVTKVYPYGKFGFDVFQVDGKYQYPFGLLDLGLNLTVGRKFIFNTPKMELIETESSEQYKLAYLAQPDGTSISPEQYVIDCHQEAYQDKENPDIIRQPHGLTVFNKKLFLFLMDNLYGMAGQKRIRSMSDYLEGFETSDLYLSDDGPTRFNAYLRSVDMLNDLHSSIHPSTHFGDIGMTDGHYEQTFHKDRNQLYSYLEAERVAAWKKYNEEHGTKVKQRDMLYSKDGRYGYFSFDSFETYSDFPEEGQPIPEATLLMDTFYYFVRNLEEAKAKGVKKIVIDDTLNGGGYVGIMGKLLALMSKDNKSEVFLRSDDNEAILRTTTRVDANNDGKYDLDDCYGNDFKFYIITSNYSFSCGNAFPFYAQQYELATIMGARSGGGECCVFEYTFGSGMNMRYSSPYHVGIYNEKQDKFYGNEHGADPLYVVAKDGFTQYYDVDAVAAYIDAQEGSAS